MMKPVIYSIRCSLLLAWLLCLLSFRCANLAAPKTGTMPKATISFDQVITEQQYNSLFPQHNAFYSYSAFVKAARQLGRIQMRIARRASSVYQFTRTDRATGKSAVIRQDADWNEPWAKQKPDSVYTIDFNLFCAEGSTASRKKELAAFLAHIAHETRNGENGKYNDGLMLLHENNTSLPYIAENDVYPPVAGQKYYGRGPMQLSYNGNYGYASDCILGDKSILLKNPGLLESDAVLAFESAIYFWMTPQTYKPSAHDVMTGKWQPNADDHKKNRTPGFGMTINIVNGALECNKGEHQENMLERIGYYRYFLSKLGASDPNCACSCGGMAAYQ